MFKASTGLAVRQASRGALGSSVDGRHQLFVELWLTLSIALPTCASAAQDFFCMSAPHCWAYLLTPLTKATLLVAGWSNDHRTLVAWPTSSGLCKEALLVMMAYNGVRWLIQT